MAYFVKFPSIEQFRNVVSNIQKKARFAGLDKDGKPIFDLSKELQTITFKGTVKLHGTNAAIIYNKALDYYRAQSRDRLLSLESDNAGFCMFAEQKRQQFTQIFEELRIANNIPDNHFIVIYGEWCGGNIQSKVALTKLPKMFVAFDIFTFHSDEEKVRESAVNLLENGKWLTSDQNLKLVKEAEHQIYPITNFQTFEITIDFNEPELVIPELQELTEKVEQECPVVKAFGVSGIGEGIVWSFLDDNQKDYYRFKVKGEKHQSSKVKKLVSTGVEKLADIQKFADYAVTESRLNQGLEHLRMNNFPLNQKSTGEFIKWVQADVLKEERDTIVENGFNMKAVNTAIAVKARTWFFQNGIAE